ncbi:hypothetical protein JMF97_15105 [Micromonospora fiedleri]|uniref:Uncharacterized protein n=1 Tax=Micromonospora fiedleri TaxID=1157498 RepID=A0ABS1UMD9_9ACTN|nr:MULTISPECIES: hypothetical protein [Micromonospora]MBL6277487.1 hypothetical protein [Micromonospora fiedleri]WSK42334.1 hypothetical protein OG712_28425 [Micromonospora maris]
MNVSGYLLLQVAQELPTLVVLIVGAVLARRLPEPGRRLLSAGTAVLLVFTVLTALWLIALPWLAAENVTGLVTLSTILSVINALVAPVGIGLLIAAALAAHRNAPASGAAVPHAPAAWGAPPPHAQWPPAETHWSPTGSQAPPTDSQAPPTDSR